MLIQLKADSWPGWGGGWGGYRTLMWSAPLLYIVCFYSAICLQITKKNPPVKYQLQSCVPMQRIFNLMQTSKLPCEKPRLKGTLALDFGLLFLQKASLWSPDFYPSILSNINSNSPRNSNSKVFLRIIRIRGMKFVHNARIISKVFSSQV